MRGMQQRVCQLFGAVCMAFISTGPVAGQNLAGASAKVEPAQAQTGRTVYLKGIPNSLGDPEITARVIAPEPSNDELLMLTLREPGGDIAVMVPLSPAGPDKAITLRLSVPGLITTTPLDLRILPLAPAPGAAVKLAQLAVDIVSVEANRAGTSGDALA